MANWTWDEITPDREFYSEEHHGSLREEDFVRTLPDAVAEVASYIHTGADISDYVDRIKHAVCAVCELSGDESRRLASYSAGNVSETFRADAGFDTSVDAIVGRWLSGTGILKRGQWV